MKKCPFCAEEIQDEAIVCRYCNRELTTTIIETAAKPTPAYLPAQETKKTSVSPLLIIFIVIAILIILIATDQSGNKPNTPDNVSAFNICKQFIGERLKAPATAQYPLYTDAQYTKTDSQFTVTSYVDAQNGFGALIRLDFTCKVKYIGNNRWNLVDLQITNR